MNIEAIIFDCDGTLVDTMPLHYAAYKQVFAEIGLELTTEQFYSNVGGIAKEVIPKFLNNRHSPISIQQIHHNKKEIISQIIDTQEIKVLETAKLINVFRSKFKLAVASSGSKAHVHKIIDKLQWNTLFDVVLTGEDVINGKPAPDIFLLAAQKMQVEPKYCLVFEDTEDGISAAKAAGMQYFNINGVSGKYDL